MFAKLLVVNCLSINDAFQLFLTFIKFSMPKGDMTGQELHTFSCLYITHHSDLIYLGKEKMGCNHLSFERKVIFIFINLRV